MRSFNKLPPLADNLFFTPPSRKPMAQPSAPIECTQQLNNVTHVLSVLRKALLTKPRSSVEPVAISSLSNIRLPPTPSITMTLKAYNVPRSVVGKITATYERHVLELRQCTEAQIRELVDFLGKRKCPTHALEKQVARCLADYQSRVNHWHQVVIDQLQNASLPLAGTKHERSTFNASQTPLLERYLSHNAFPSPDDRIWLAHKTGNTPRQIEIWFQNRRRRSRKAGIELKRTGPDGIPLVLRLGDLETQSPPPALPVKTKHTVPVKTPTPLTLPSIAKPPVSYNFTDHEPPQHAFPAKYNQDTMPSIWSRPIDFDFQKPDWDRKSIPCTKTTTESHRPPVISEDDLATLMASSLRLFSKHPISKPETPWYTIRYTYPPSAPLPAFIRPDSTPITSTNEIRPKPSSTTPITAKLSLKRKRSELGEEEQPPNKQRRSVSSSSYTSSTDTCSTSCDDSSCASPSPSPQTPPSPPLSSTYDPIYLRIPRFIDWQKLKIPTVPRMYGLC